MTVNNKENTSAKQRNKRVRLPGDLSQVERFAPTKEQGLLPDQVVARQEAGLVNNDTTKKGKSIAGIVFSNIFTFFNIIYMVITVVLCVYKLFDQLGFLPVVICNSAIAMVQEIRSKRTLDKLNIITEPHVKVVRNGEMQTTTISDLVLDDVVQISNGEQISADCTVLDGYVEVNESILTGESDAVVKRAGDTLFAGSYVLSGSCTAQVSAVGKYNYIAKLTGRARQYQKPRSQILKALRGILIFVAIIIVPFTVGLYVVNAHSHALQQGTTVDWSTLTLANLDEFALKRTSGSIISMIPAGPFLLTSVALAASFLRLAKNKTMVQELYCIEMLARVDTLCLDKTGTITDGTMRVVESIDLRPQGATHTVREIMASLNAALQADNITSKALKKYFGCPKKAPLEEVTVVPFSSERKLSAVSFKGAGTYILGAPEYVLKTPNDRVSDLVKKYAEQGLRVLLLAHSSTMIYNNKTLPQTRRPIAVIVIEDHIRSDAHETIEWFKANGVEVKVISGDNPMAVSSIAMRVGIVGAESYISLEGMSEEQVREAAAQYTVFGRVSPDQKAILIKALRSEGRTVAMTGDGVNDILAMKESDCSISLAGGSDAARQVSHLVLMDDSFTNLTKVVAEGRRVVNNIQSASSMYFMKTVFVLVINLMIMVLHFCFDITLETPLETRKVMLMDWIVTALPTTLLALQTNTQPIKGRFFVNVIKRCMPASLTFIVGAAAIYVLHAVDGTFVSTQVLATMVTIVYTCGGLFALFYACKPFNKWKIAMYVLIWVIVALFLLVPWLRNFLSYEALNREQVLLTLVLVLATPFVLFVFQKAFDSQLPLKRRKRTR